MKEMLNMLEKRRDDLIKGSEKLKADLYATDGAIQELEKTIGDLKKMIDQPSTGPVLAPVIEKPVKKGK